MNKTDGAFIKVTSPNSDNSELEIYSLEAGKTYFIPTGVRFSTGTVREIDHFHVHFDVMGMPDLAMRTLLIARFAYPPTTGCNKLFLI